MTDNADRSWWENVPRAVWPDVQRHHEALMAGTRFAKLNQLSTALTVSSEDERRFRPKPQREEAVA